MLPSQAEKQRTNEYFAEPTCERANVGTRGDKWECFAPDTQIEMSNSQLKPATEIHPDDLVWNPKKRQMLAIKDFIAGPEKIALFEIKTSDRALTVTIGHPF